MEIRHRGNAETSQYGGRFTGAVRLDMLLEAADASAPDTALVHFEDGAATFWHAHPGGQLLYLESGAGRVGTEEGEVALRPGDLVHAPAGERHWHGAAPGERCTFLALTWGTTAWEDVAP
jgi:quercetin dioxygenase-like cupin family protein